jgi:colanic acid biosynthesis glycosyl transferase WcaI
MRILILSQYFWPENFRINDLAAAFIEHGHEVVVLTGQPCYNLITKPGDDTPLSEYAGAKILRVPIVLRKEGKLRLLLNYLSFVLSASTVGLWKLRNEKFDVIFSPQLSPVTAVLPAILARWIWKRKLVIWILDLWPDTLEALGIVKSPRLLGLVGRLVGFIYDHCDLIYIQSRSFFPKVQERARKRPRIKYLPSWSEALASPDMVDFASEVVRRTDMFTIIFTGNIGETQDFPSIVEAATLLRNERNVRFVIVGEGRMAEWVRKQIDARRLTNIIMTGAFSLERMPSFFKHADALLVTLKAEPIFAMTIPGKVQSYLASGRPILAMLDGEGRRVIEEAKAGLAAPAGDPQALAAAIIQMKQMPSKVRAAMGMAGLDYSKAQFDRQTLVGTIEAQLQKLVESKLIRED